MTKPRAAAASDSPLAVAAIGGLGLAAAMGIGRFAFTPLLPLMQRDGQIDLAQGAWLASANYLGYLIGALACARWSVPPAAAVRGGLLAVALFTLVMGAGGGFELWLAWRLLAGAASAFVLVGVSAWALPALAALGRPAWAGAVYAGVGGGIALAGLIGLEAALAPRPAAGTWIGLGALAAAVALPAWRLVRPEPARSAATAAPAGTVTIPAADPTATAALAGDRTSAAGAWRLVAAYGAFGYGYILPATFLPAIARQLFADPLRFGVVWPIFGLAAALSTLAAAALARRLAPRALWALAQATMAAGVLAPLASSSLAALLASALGVGGTFMVVTMAGMQEARRVGGATAPRLMGAMTAAFAAGQLLGPLTVGPLDALLGRGADVREAVPLGATLVAATALVLGVMLLAGARRPPRG